MLSIGGRAGQSIMHNNKGSQRLNENFSLPLIGQPQASAANHESSLSLKPALKKVQFDSNTDFKSNKQSNGGNRMSLHGYNLLASPT